MTIQDLVIIGVMSVPMLMFSIFPGIWVSDYLEEKYEFQERQKRAALIATTMLFAFTISTLLHFI
ncbi:hypothetical protein [Sulfurimonas denitrificans]|jgi:hypothetical protein|uniref:hypothetical protein n=1 Tax=Sulfurimonas denitrificans TaxID=39766 RepID=UPI0005A04A7F|nr:hypothetical protein [Sulfurimonas denitrificans]MDD3442052.1 hypothetical protein [Sulfurimonas denitrificans]